MDIEPITPEENEEFNRIECESNARMMAVRYAMERLPNLTQEEIDLLLKEDDAQEK